MAQIAILVAVQVGLAVVSSLLAPKPKLQPIDRGKQDDLRFTIVEEGAFIPRVYGEWVRLGGNIFWGTPTQERKTSTPGRSGGKKGRGAEPPTTTYSYDKDFAVYFCEGPVRSFYKIQEGDILLFNQSVGHTSYYEAEKSGNTFAGGAIVILDDTLLSKRKVRLPPGASVTFTSVRANFLSSYDIGIYYQSVVDIPVTVRVNSFADFPTTLTDSNDELAVVDVSVTLNAGINTVKITNDHVSDSVDIDRLFAFAELIDDDDLTGIVDVTGDYPSDLDDPTTFYNKALRVDANGQAAGTTVAAGQAGIEIFLGTEDQEPPAAIVTAEGAANAPAFRGLAGFSSTNHQVENGQLQNISAELEPLISDLAEVIAAEYKLRGAVDDDLDLSALEGITVEGLYIDKLAPLGETLEALKFFYNFDIVPADGKIKAVLRGGDSVRTIPYNELLAHEEGSEPPAGIRIQHIESADLPGGLYVVWVSPDASKQFHSATQFVPLNSNGPSIEAETINLPLVVSNPDDIVAAGKRWLFLQHLVNHPLEFNLDPKHRDLIPTDVVTLELPQKTIDVCLTAKQAALPGLVKTKAVPENAGLYNQTGIGELGTGAEGRKVKFPANSFIYLGDVPLFDGEDDRLRWIAAACPRGLGDWQGARLHKESIQASDEFNPLFPFPAAGTLGHLVADVPAIANTLAIDHINEIKINLLYDDGSLASVSEADILARPVNQFVIESGFNAEIFRAATVTPETPTFPYVARYKLTDILHGLYGTEAPAAAGHEAGATVLLLNDAVRSYPEEAAELGRERNYIGVSVGQAVPDALANGATPFTFRGYSKKPYSVTGIKGYRTADGDAIIEWVRRSRVAGIIRDLTGIALGEDDLRFLLEILNLSNDVVYSTWVQVPAPVFVPWVDVQLAAPTDRVETSRSTMALDPYNSFVELTLKPDSWLNIRDANTPPQINDNPQWQITTEDAGGGSFDFAIFEAGDLKFSATYTATDIRPRFRVRNGIATFYDAYINEDTIPVYQSGIAVPNVGPLHIGYGVYKVGGGHAIGSVTNAIMQNKEGLTRAYYSGDLQLEHFGSLQSLGSMRVRITQYSALVGPGAAATGFV